MANPDYFYKRYPQAYIQDTRHLPWQVRAVYSEFIDRQRLDERPLPHDIGWLACAFHMPRSVIKRGIEKLMAEGMLIRSQGGLINPKCMADIAARLHQREVNTATAQARSATKTRNKLGQNSEKTSNANDRVAPEKASDINQSFGNSFHEAGSIREVKKVDSEDITPPPPEGGVRAKSKSKRKSRAKPKADPLHVQQAYERYCEFARDNGKTVPRRLPNLERKIAARLVEFGLDGWMKAIGNIELSRLLMGDRPFSDGSFCVVTIGMITRPENFAKLHDGGYGNDRKPRPKPSTVTFEPAQWRRGISKLIEERRNWDALSPPTPPPHSPGYCVPREIHDELDVGAHFATDGSGHFVAKQSRMPLPAPTVPQGRVSGQPALHAPEVR